MKRLLPFLTLVLALVAAPSALAGGPTMTVGATEDAVRSVDPVRAKAQMDLIRLAGLDAVRITEIWAPGEKSPTPQELTVLGNVAAAARLDGMRVIASVTNFGSRTTPLTDEDQADFAAYAAAVAKALPGVRDYIIGNEPNLNRYWLPQFGLNGADVAAPAYESLLANTYDALKAVSPKITVWGGAVSPRGVDRPNTGRDAHSPTAFITDMGTAYRASARTLPIMDGFAFHPYGDNSSQPPTTGHPNTTAIGLGDYDKLVGLLGRAFDGTPQLGSTLPIVYDEYGVETQIPSAKQRLYVGREPATTKPVDETTQASYYQQAIGLAFCQPNVRGIFLFHTIDERDLDRWQSGLYYVNGKPKSSLKAVRAAALESRRGVVARCDGLELPVRARVDRFSRQNGRFAFRLRCDIDCVYRARVEKLPAGSTTLAKSGRAPGGAAVRVAFPSRRLAPGRYRFTVRLVAPVNPGPPLAIASGAFSLS